MNIVSKLGLAFMLWSILLVGIYYFLTINVIFPIIFSTVLFLIGVLIFFAGD